jgi:TRAP-type C4-dicarboxylate transport system permease small subunit
MAMMRFLLRDAEKIAAAILFVAMTALGFINVVVRYMTNRSFAATEELLVNGFLLLTLLGAAIAARRGDHLAVTVVFDALPKAGRRLLLWGAGLLSIGLLGLSAWYCGQLVATQMASGTTSYALRVPAWYYTAGLPVCFVLVAVRYLQHALEHDALLRAGADDGGQARG